MAEVRLRQVRKSYDGKTPVIHGIDLDVRHGEFAVFVGPSGCGKSTLLRMIAGLETVDSGEIRIGDRPVQGLPPRQRDIAMVFQDYALYPHKTLYENMAFGLRLRGTPDAEIRRRVGDAAELLKISHLLERMAPILLAGLQMIPRSLYEAAEVDGASPWQQFWQVTVPMLMPSIVVALIFRTITALQTFDIPYTMTKGGPGHATQALAMLIHATTSDYLDLGYGSTLAVCMFVLSLGVTAVYLRHIGRQAQ